MGMFKLIWADNVPAIQSIQIKIPEGWGLAYPYGAEVDVSSMCTPPMTPTCRHEWKDVPGIYKVYSNCKHCGIGKETLSAENS